MVGICNSDVLCRDQFKVTWVSLRDMVSYKVHEVILMA